MFNFKKSLLALAILFFSGSVLAAQEIVVWHSLEGILNDTFLKLVQQFNQKPENVRDGVRIIAEYKGNYEQTLEAGLKVKNTPKAPQILQVFEMGNVVMQTSDPCCYVPLNKLSDKPSPLLQIKQFIPVISAFYKDRNDEKNGMASLPFSASTVVLFYNKDAFRKAGLDPETPPTTWEEFEKAAIVLKAHGAKNVLATGWLSGHNIDQLGAWHDQPIATFGNGLDGQNAELILNRPFFIHHLKKLANWYQMGIFTIENRVKAEQAFGRGDVLIFTQSANRLSILEKLVAGKFEIGVTTLPYWKERVNEPQNTIAGGASFWAMAGHDPKVYPNIQRFFEFLVNPEVQNYWHQETCYLPVVSSAIAIAEKQKFYDLGLKGKASKIALTSFLGKTPKENSRGILLPQFPKIRELMLQEMKEAIKGNKTAEQALDQMVLVGNQIMRDGNKP